MRFYQTYVKYAILVNERRESYATAKVPTILPHSCTLLLLCCVCSQSMGPVLEYQMERRALD